MLSYLAASLPPGTSAAACLLALQCALRMNATMQVRLHEGMLRSLRLNTPDPWHELEHARWLRTIPANADNEVVAELLDVTLMGQAPARRDRLRAADWALRTSTLSTAATAVPLLRMAGLCLAAHADPEDGTGLSDLDQLARTCGIDSLELPNTLDQLAVTGLVRLWEACPDSGEMYWALAAPSSVPSRSSC